MFVRTTPLRVSTPYHIPIGHTGWPNQNPSYDRLAKFFLYHKPSWFPRPYWILPKIYQRICHNSHTSHLTPQKRRFHMEPRSSNRIWYTQTSYDNSPHPIHSQFSIPFDLKTNASGKAMGALLMQNNKPIAFFSKQFCPRLIRSSTYVRELHAITTAVKKWRQYLLGHPFNIHTDHKKPQRTYLTSLSDSGAASISL